MLACYGGFLDNKNQHNDIVVGSSYHRHKLSNRDLLYKAVNFINSTKFTLNTDFFNFIDNEEKYLIDETCFQKSKALPRDIALIIAHIYYNFPFYLNVNCDWIGGIYTNSLFLTRRWYI